MTDSTAPQDTPKPAKHNRTMVVAMVIALVGFVALIALNMK
jgi:hypothetical protein